MLLNFTDAAVDPLWKDLNLGLRRGEMIAVLGPNGVGKSTLLGTILGTRKLTHGTVETKARIGFIPQQRMFPRDLPLRSRDLVSLASAHGVLRKRRASQGDVDQLLERVGATGLAERRVGELSGGQQQLVRQAQALPPARRCCLPTNPCSVWIPASSSAPSDCWGNSGAEGIGQIIVTHDINPLIRLVDRILYLAPHGHTIGTVTEVMQSDRLSALYDARVTVVRVDDRIVVV